MTKTFLVRFVGWTVLFLALAGYMVVCVKRGNDFLTFYELGRTACEKKGHIYDPMPRTGMRVFYLPHFALLMMPWALIPQRVSASVWFIAKFGMLVSTVRLFSHWTSSRHPTKGQKWLNLLPLLLCANFINNDFRLGQVNLIVHVLMIFSVVALGAQKYVLSSLLFVVASFKVAPLLVLPYFVIRRQWKFLLGAVGWSAISALLLVAWFGWHEAGSLAAQWLATAHTYKLVGPDLATPSNQSLFAAAARLSNFLDAGIYPYGAYGTSVLLAAAVCLWTALHGAKGIQVGEFSVFIVLMLLISPDTRSPHMTQLLLPSYVLLTSVQSRRFHLREHWWIILLATVFLGTSRDIIGDTARNYVLSLSVPTMAMILVLALLMLRCRTSRGFSPLQSVAGTAVSSGPLKET